MNCPACEAAVRMDVGKLRVARTRDLGNVVERDRQCPDCGHKLVTHEVESGELTALRNEAERLREKLDNIMEQKPDPDYQPGDGTPWRLRGF